MRNHEAKSGEIEAGLNRCSVSIRRKVHQVVDAAWLINDCSTSRPYPIYLAERMRAAIIEAGKLEGGLPGDLFADGGRKGYWIQKMPYGEHKFLIWFIDRSNELGSDKPAAAMSSVAEVFDWIKLAQNHAFSGDIDSAGEWLRYIMHRQLCIATNANSVWVCDQDLV